MGSAAAAHSEVAPNDHGLMFYTQPEPLSHSAHANLGLNPVDRPYWFLAEAQYVPLVVDDFSSASQVYPIVFKSMPGGGLRPTAVISALPGSGPFAKGEDGQEPAYVPSYVRRYPFASARNAQNGDMVLIIDRAAAMVSADAEAPFFASGEVSPTVQQAIRYCALYQKSEEQTALFTRQLVDLELLEHRMLCRKSTGDDEKAAVDRAVADYWTISQEKLDALKNKDFLNLRKSGALPLIYAQILSQWHWKSQLSEGAR